jgi:LCP family protein required for cell wall assembly
MHDRRRVAGRTFVALLSTMVLFVTGYGWRAYHNLSTGLTKSNALSGLPTPGRTSSIHASTSSIADTNILIMGLDSRRDQNGNPLPKDVLAQLHAGDSDNGGYNTNVLMLLHVPGNGGHAQAISIPRDDYVELPDSPDNTPKEKIKEAYGLAKADKESAMRGQGVTDHAQLEQAGREAGRRETIHTVRQFLGGVPIDHFVEVTLVGFYDLANALGSVTVCLRGPTQDSYSGAKFVTGYQQLNPAQALAFVRQRRDYVHPDLNFTDLDRERRQQAYLASAAYQLRSLGTFADPGKLTNLINVATQDVVIDSGFDLLGFLEQSTGLLSGNITFTTLPVTKFGKKDGQDVNLVEVDQIQTMVHNILDPDHPAPAVPPSAPTQLPVATLDVVNAAGHNGIASSLESTLTARGLIKGSASTERTLTDHTMLTYAPDAADSANALTDLLGQVTPTEDPDLRPGHERLVIGTDFTMPATLNGTNSGEDADNPQTGTPPPPASPASSISGGGIPCVK